MYPYTFGYGRNISFSYSRYEQKDTLNYITKGLYLKNGISNFNEVFPFYLGTSYKGLRDITAYQNREYSLEKIFTENGIPTNYVQFYYPNPNIYNSKTRMLLNAEVQKFTDLELKCEEESSSNNEVILYAVWKDPRPIDTTDGYYYEPNDDPYDDDEDDYYYYYPSSSTILNLPVLLLLISLILL